MKCKKGRISIGPLTDGRTYIYDQKTSQWYDKEGPADYLPYEYTNQDDRKIQVQFHPGIHKWTDEYGFILPTGQSNWIDCAFRREYGLNGEAKLLTLKEEIEDMPEQEGPYESPASEDSYEGGPGLFLKEPAETEEEEALELEEMLIQSRKLRGVA